MNKLLSFILLLSFSAMAVEEVTNYTITAGRYHQGGKAQASILSTDAAKEIMTVELKYQVYKRALVPVPSEYLKGSEVEELPLEFIDERGYLALEESKTKDLPEATLIYMGRVNIGSYQNGHYVRIKAKNGKSDTDIYYHPQIPGLGWGKVQLFIHTNIPLLKNYNIMAVLNGLN